MDRIVDPIGYLTQDVSLGGRHMRTVILIVAGWTLLSCTVGPLLAWLFFYGERQQRDAHRIEARSGRVAEKPMRTGGERRVA